MKLFITNIAVIGFLVIPIFLNGQSKSYLDSLETTLVSISGKQKIETLIELTRGYSTKDSARANEFVKEALGLSFKVKDSKLIGKSYMNLGVVAQENFQYKRAEKFFVQADSVFEQIDYSLGRGSAKKAIARSLVLQGYADETIVMAKEAYKYFEMAQDTLAMYDAIYLMGYGHYRLRNYDSTLYYYFKVIPFCDSSDAQVCLDIYNQLGTTYSEIKEPEKAMKYLKLSLNINLARNNLVFAANSLMNLAGLYFFQNDLDSCTYFLNQSIAMYGKAGDLRGQLLGLNNMGVLYVETGQLSKAMKPNRRAIGLAKKLNDRNVLAGGYMNISDLYSKQRRFEMADIYADSGFQLAKELNSKYHFQQYYLYMSKSKRQQKKFDEAFELNEMYHVYKDSMLNENTTKQIAELETKYETEKKEQQIALLNKDKELQAAVIESNRIGIIALIVFIFSGIIMVYWLFKRTQYKQKLTLEVEKAKLKEEQVKAIINSQEKERKRFAMDLHDDFGQLLSAMRLNVHSMKEIATDNAIEITNKSEKLIDNMYSSLKNIAFDLMPHTLFEKGLEEALDELKDQINVSSGLRLEVQSFGIKNKIQGEQKIALYRIIQEFISNIIKYSVAKNVNISITDHENGLSLMIEDDGLGYDLNVFKNAKGNGWKNIHSRLDLLQGEIEFDTVLGRKNTTISIDIPYEIHEEIIAA